MKEKISIGQAFGQLTVIDNAGIQDVHKGRQWLCRCGCGTEIVTLGAYLKAGYVTACPECTQKRLLTGMKKCTKCGIEKPVHQFFLVRRRSGLSSYMAPPIRM